MSMRDGRFHGAALFLVAAGVVVVAVTASSQSPFPSTGNGEWPHYTADLNGSRYSPLDQINAAQLQQARSGVALQDRQPRHAARIQARRHAAHGQAACSTRPPARAARSIALDAKTGELIWVHALREGKRARDARPRQLSGRGAVVLDRRQGRRPHHLRDARLPAGRAQREDRRSRSRRSARTASST